MCRVIGYLGPAVRLEDLLIKPANSLVKQTISPIYHPEMQLAGFGFAAWLEEDSICQSGPLVYKSAQPAFYDHNLHELCTHIYSHNFLAHVRAVGYDLSAEINRGNCHPFVYPGFRLALAHNGDLLGWRALLRDILGSSSPSIVANLRGCTDTEALYCLLMSQYANPFSDMEADEIVDGLERFIKKLLDIKIQNNNYEPATLKFFLADGNDLVVANISISPNCDLDFNQYPDIEALQSKGVTSLVASQLMEPIWYTSGKGQIGLDGVYCNPNASNNDVDTIIVASEHLTLEQGDWEQLPIQSLVFLRRNKLGYCTVEVRRLPGC